MSTTVQHTNVGRRAGAVLRLASLAVVFAGVHCFGSSGQDCHPGDCAPGHHCTIGGGCELSEGSCASDDDCPEGEGCALFEGTGILGRYTDARCARKPGEPGQRCGAAALGMCVERASCVSGRDVELSPGAEATTDASIEPDAAPTGADAADVTDAGVTVTVTGSGHTYWRDSLVTFSYVSTLRDPVCVAYGSVALGGRCSGPYECSGDLICHWGYTPRQCRPPSALGGPCLETGDCAEGECVLPELVRTEAMGAYQCALADPRCDVRVDASCGYWLSCGQCLPGGGEGSGESGTEKAAR